PVIDVEYGIGVVGKLRRDDGHVVRRVVLCQRDHVAVVDLPTRRRDQHKLQTVLFGVLNELLAPPKLKLTGAQHQHQQRKDDDRSKEPQPPPLKGHQTPITELVHETSTTSTNDTRTSRSIQSIKRWKVTQCAPAAGMRGDAPRPSGETPAGSAARS